MCPLAQHSLFGKHRLRHCALWHLGTKRALVQRVTSNLPLPTGTGLGVKQQARRGAIPAGQQFQVPHRNPLRELDAGDGVALNRETSWRFPGQQTYTSPLPQPQQEEEEFSPSQLEPATFAVAQCTPAGPHSQDGHGRQPDTGFVPETPDSFAPNLEDSQVRRLATVFVDMGEEETQVGGGDDCHIVSVGAGAAGGSGGHMATGRGCLPAPGPQTLVQLQATQRSQGRSKQGWSPGELHDLVQLMKEQVEDTRRGGISKRATSAKRKFADLEGKMAQKGWDRTEKQLKQKWGYLSDIWKQIHDWESAKLSGRTSYWMMTPSERVAGKLPKEADKSLFDHMTSFLVDRTPEPEAMYDSVLGDEG